MTLAAYIRVSTRRRNDDRQPAGVQKWLDANGIDPKKVEWYPDKESGTTMKRPEFDRLQADIFHVKVKTVVMWKLDRLGEYVSFKVSNDFLPMWPARWYLTNRTTPTSSPSTTRRRRRRWKPSPGATQI